MNFQKEKKCHHIFVILIVTFILISGNFFNLSASAADTYPNKPIKLIVPWKPGTGTDRSARLLAPYLSEELGVPVNIINIGGGGGWVAWTQMARWEAPKDDHMLGYVNVPHVLSLLNPKMKRKETLDSFGWLCLHTLSPCVWVVKEGDERFQTLKDVIDYGKKNPKKLIFSMSPPGSDDHLGVVAAEKAIEGFSVEKVFTNDDASRISMVLGGTGDVIASNVDRYVMPAVEGKLRPICVLNNERVIQFPTVPTFQEVTGHKIISAAARFLCTPTNLDEQKRQILLSAIEKAFANPEYQFKNMRMGVNVDFRKGEEIKEFLADLKELALNVAYWEEEE